MKANIFIEFSDSYNTNETSVLQLLPCRSSVIIYTASVQILLNGTIEA